MKIAYDNSVKKAFGNHEQVRNFTEALKKYLSNPNINKTHVRVI